jgi:multimeric flavodoxin WrbA
MEKPSLKAIGLLGTLKPKGGEMGSNTEELLGQVFGELSKLGVSTEVVRLIDHDIKHGLQTDMEDAWPGILPKIKEADIVVFATPIWWGQPSSLIQKVIERMDQVDNEYMMSGMSPLTHKVAGIVVTGHEDGVQHVIGTLANALTWYGFALPPEMAAYWVGEAGPPMDQDADKRRKNMATKMMVMTMSQNLYRYAKMIKDNKAMLEQKM